MLQLVPKPLAKFVRIPYSFDRLYSDPGVVVLSSFNCINYYHDTGEFLHLRYSKCYEKVSTFFPRDNFQVSRGNWHLVTTKLIACFSTDRVSVRTGACALTLQAYCIHAVISSCG